MQVFTHGDQAKLGFFSGIHGDEWRVIPSVKKAIDRYKSRLGSFLFIPECSPSAVMAKTRTNSEGIDLNRSFTKNPSSEEAKIIVQALSSRTFELCIDFHEDVELSGIYVYDSENIEGSKSLNFFRKQVKKIAPLFSGLDDPADTQLGRLSHEGYRVSLPPEKNSNGDYIYEGFLDYWMLIEKRTKRWMTLEVPTNLTSKQKDQIVDIFFQAFVLNENNDII